MGQGNSQRGRIRGCGFGRFDIGKKITVSRKVTDAVFELHQTQETEPRFELKYEKIAGRKTLRHHNEVSI